MQLSQSLEVDKTILSGAERSLALKHDESEDLALIHKAHDRANEVLKAKVLHHGRKFDVSSLHRFLVNQAAWGIFFEVVRGQWRTSPKTTAILRRVVQILEVHGIQTIFETLQKQISTLRHVIIKFMAYPN